MSEPPLSDFTSAFNIVVDVGVEVLADPRTWVNALNGILSDGRYLAWPRPGPRAGYPGLLQVAFDLYVDHACWAVLEGLGEESVRDQADPEFQIVLRVAQAAIEQLDVRLVEWSRDVRLIGPLRGVREFRNWHRAELAAGAVKASGGRGQRAAALAAKGLSKSAAYRALARKPQG